MTYSNILKSLLSLSLIALAFATTAQQMPPQQQVRDDFSDNEIKQFVDINKKIAPLQEAGTQKMMSAITEEKLEVQRFNQIMEAMQKQDLESAKASQDEVASFNKAVQKVQAIQQEVNNEIQEKITDEGMKIQTFTEIGMAYQQSPKVQEKINKLLAEENEDN